jgi:glycosyltransferase involved in cell wall biosynthesis
VPADPGKRKNVVWREALVSPVVSVVIAVKNAARYLAQCLDSVTAQTFQDYEVLIVDGHSTDETETIARSYPNVRFLQQDGLGFSDAWNSGIKRAAGSFIAFIDSDDYWEPNKLELQVALLDSRPELLAVTGTMRFFLERGETPPRGFQDKVLGVDHLAAKMPGTLMVRKELFDRIGLFDPDFSVTSDVDWFARLQDSGLAFGAVPELVLHKRVHGGNLSLVTASSRHYPREMVQLLHESIERKRSAAAEAK